MEGSQLKDNPGRFLPLPLENFFTLHSATFFRQHCIDNVQTLSPLASACIHRWIPAGDSRENRGWGPSAPSLPQPWPRGSSSATCCYCFLITTAATPQISTAVIYAVTDLSLLPIHCNLPAFHLTFLVCPCIYLHMHGFPWVCICLGYWCTCVHIGGQSSNSCYPSRWLGTLRQGSSLAWGSPIRLALLALKFRESTYLHPVSTGIASSCATMPV